MKNLHDLFIEQLKDVYDLEHQLVEALPKMGQKASNEDLKEAFKHHLEETRTQLDRVDTIFRMLSAKPGRISCEGMEGIIAEGEEMMQRDMPDELMDAALIASAQRAEHYEISAYGTLCAYADEMGHDDICGILNETLEEEKNADSILNSIAIEQTNPAAAEM